MSCIITYNNKKYTQPEFNEYFKSHFFEFAGDFISQDIEGFKDFTQGNQFEEHQTLEEFKKQKENRIKELESRLNDLKNDNFTNLNVFNFAEVNLEEAKKIITNSFINATEEEAKLIYRKFSVQYHPDKGGSEELMKHLNDINDKFKNGKLNREKQKINEQAVRKFYEEIKDNLEKHREGDAILGKTYNSNTFKYKNDIKLTSQDFVVGILSNKGYFKVGNFIRYALQNPNLFEADSLEILKNLTKGQYYNSANNLANTSIRVGNPSEFSSINSLGAVFVNKSSTKGYADISEIHINPAYFDIKFFEDSFNNDKFKEFVNTIGHELVHKLTIPDLLSDSTTRKEIEEIYKAAKESYKNYNGIKNNITDYALSNLSEFTANYFNSKEFKDFLKTVIVKSENNKNKSLLDKLITVIARFFNKNYGIIEKNAYDYLTSVINNNTFYGVPNKVFVKKGNYSAVNEAIQDEKSNIQNEINQLKQELERVDKEGFGALRPIYDFDENTDLDNVLKEKKLLEYLNKQIKYIDEEGNECAKFGLKTSVSGTNWRIEENLNWGKKHSEGGIDLTMTDDGIVFRRNNSDIKASHGLVIKAEDGLVMPDESNIDGEDPKKPPKYPKSIKIKDGRVKNPITGKPFNGNKSGDYDYLLMHEVVHNAKKYGIDPYNFLAMAMQETTLGKAGGGMSNPFHILNSSTIESKMDKKRYSEYFKNKTDRMRPVEMAANFYKNVKLLDKPKKKNPNI